MNIKNWLLRLVPAIIILQTVFRFKFPGHPDSIEIFSKVARGALGSAEQEALIRLSTGGVELIAGILLLIPTTSRWGAILTFGTMMGAILSHLLFLGIDALFFVAIIVAACSAVVIWQERAKIPVLSQLLPTHSPA